MDKVEGKEEFLVNKDDKAPMKKTQGTPYNDPHDPDHPRNRKFQKESELDKEDGHQAPYTGGDPHHPDHPRNRH